MADSFYHVIEMRIVDLVPTSSDANANVEVFVKISDANDFMPIAGWYGARVPTGRMSFEFLQASIERQSFLVGADGWTKRDPAAAAQDERSPSYDALAIIVSNFCGALQAHGVGDDFDTPAEAIDELVRRAAAPNSGRIIGYDHSDGIDTTVYSHVDKGVVHIDRIEQIVDGWHTMESAPHDGSIIMLRWGEDGESVGWYVEDSEFPWGFVDTGSSAHEAGYFINHAKDTPDGATHWRAFPHDPARLMALARGIGLREAMHGIRATEARQMLAAFLHVVDREALHD